MQPPKRHDTYRLREARVEGVSRQRATASDASRDDVLVLGIQVHEGVDVSEVRRRMLVRRLEASVVVIDDWIEEWSEQRVGLGIRSVDSDS